MHKILCCTLNKKKWDYSLKKAQDLGCAYLLSICVGLSTAAVSESHVQKLQAEVASGWMKLLFVQKVLCLIAYVQSNRINKPPAHST